MINRARIVKSVLRTNYYQKYGLPRNATDQAWLSVESKWPAFEPLWSKSKNIRSRKCQFDTRFKF